MVTSHFAIGLICVPLSFILMCISCCIYACTAEWEILQETAHFPTQRETICSQQGYHGEFSITRATNSLFEIVTELDFFCQLN